MRHLPSTPSAVLLGLAVAVLAVQASAGDLPRRKAGLWELSMRGEGLPAMGAITQCIDGKTDDLLQERTPEGERRCSVLDTKVSGRLLTIHAVCAVQGTTATTDGVFEGSFDSAYTGTLTTRFDPPLHGRAETRLTQQARWLGPCLAGQKPGDVVVPNRGAVNVEEMMKDPRVQEMLKRRKQAAPGP